MRKNDLTFGLKKSFKSKFQLGSTKLECIFALVLTVSAVLASFTLADSTVDKAITYTPDKNGTSRIILPKIPKMVQPKKFSKIKNVILMIGDGMGPEQVKAANFFAYGKKGQLAFQQLPYSGTVETYALTRKNKRSTKLYKTITDSAAAATAIATGKKVFNGVISLDLPGKGKPLKTILEQAQDAGWKTGLVTTCTITHATPACFAAHVRSRNLARRIGQQMLRSKVDLMMGGGCRYLEASAAEDKGFEVVQNREQMNKLDSLEKPILGRFGEGHLIYEYHKLGKSKSQKTAKKSGNYNQNSDAENYETLPHLSEMTSKALELLSKNNDNGFFLMVEGGRIDHAGHINSLKRNIYETLEFDLAVRNVLKWASKRDDTLVIVTADHETGGLKVKGNKGAGNWPKVSWASRKHSNADVYIFAWGIGAADFEGEMNNVDIPKKIRAIIRKSGNKKARKAFYDPKYKLPILED